MKKKENKLPHFFRIIEEYITNPYYNNNEVVKYNTPSELHQKIKIAVTESGEDMDSLIDYANKYFQLSVNTGNKQFLNQLYQGFNLPAFMGDVVTIAANTSIYTYEVAPVATEIEREMVRLMNSYAGYKNGDGIFLTGGSNANLVAMFSARNRLFPETRLKGVDMNMKLKAFVNEQAHYSFDTAANLLGIGTQNVVKVKADRYGRMVPEELSKEIEASIGRGEKPFFVGATCGTTVIGAFDSIEQIAPICQKHKIWLHADGAFGGSLILSPKYKNELFKGLEQTDSFAWDAHKLMNIPLMCSVVLVKTPGTLQHNIIDADTEYIYHDLDDIEDLGKKSIQCGRRVDAVKLWFAWKHFGKKGYAKRMENIMKLAEYAESIVNNNPHLELVVPRQTVTICFRYLPNEKFDLNDFNLKIREALRKSGKSMVNFAYIGNDLVIRLVISNNEMGKKDVDKFFANFLSVAERMEGQNNA